MNVFGLNRGLAKVNPVKQITVMGRLRIGRLSGSQESLRLRRWGQSGYLTHRRPEPESLRSESNNTKRQREKLSCLITSLDRLKDVATPEQLTLGSHLEWLEEQPLESEGEAGWAGKASVPPTPSSGVPALGSCFSSERVLADPRGKELDGGLVHPSCGGTMSLR